MRRWVGPGALLAGLAALALSLPPAAPSAALGPAGWLAGVVVDYATGAPLAGATVERVGGVERARAAADGSFLLLLPAGRQRIVARAPDYLAEEETQAIVPPGGTSERLFALLPERPDAQTAARIAARWQRGERGAPAHQAAGLGPGGPAAVSVALAGQQAADGAAGEPTLGLRASARAPGFRALLPALQRGCGPPTAPAGATLTIRVLLPNGCVVLMDVEEYLKGVVPVEMPPLWPAEALKAQAIAARTYALARAAALPNGAQVDTTSLTQGFSTRRYPTTDAAVEATRGQVVLYDGKLAQVFYFADSGGATEATENVWGGKPQPYLKGADDRALTSTICGRLASLCWTETLSEPELRARLAVTSTIASATIVATYPSGRLKTLQVRTSDGQTQTTTLLSERWRQRLETRSALITALSRLPDGSFRLVGQGWGHGLGMPQWGAWARAQQGQTVQAILGHYFPGTTIGAAPPRATPP